MFEVHSDLARNRLYLTMAGRLDRAERQALIKAILTQPGKLVKGVAVV